MRPFDSGCTEEFLKRNLKKRRALAAPFFLGSTEENQFGVVCLVDGFIEVCQFLV